MNSKNPLSIFLPCASSLFTKVLRVKIIEYSYLVSKLLKVTELLQKGDLSLFDPLVGDTACHIRALKICVSFSNCLASLELNLPRLKYIKYRLDNLINNNEVPSRGSVDDFLENNDLNIELCKDDLFMLASYFLTLVKEILPPDEDNPLVQKETTRSSKLKNLDDSITTRFLDNLVSHLRRFLASASVNYMREEAQIVPCKEIASKMISSDFSINHNNLECASIFWTNLIVVERALALGLPIILIANQKILDYPNRILNKASLLLNPIGNSYHLANPKNINPNKLAIIVKGTTCQSFFNLSTKRDWIKKLVSYQPRDLFLAYSAMHRQFPDATKDHLITQHLNPKFEEYRQKSMEWGCCLENPELFFISHVYCQKIGNIPNLLDPEEIFGVTHRKRFSIGSIEKRTKRATVYIGNQVINF